MVARPSPGKLWPARRASLYSRGVGERIVRVFHLSDLHMRSADGPQRERARLEAPFRWRVLGEKWDRNLAELRADGIPFDLVVFTGDLADWVTPPTTRARATS
jgi:predicted MPP superfamily phosphohydrolase